MGGGALLPTTHSQDNLSREGRKKTTVNKPSILVCTIFPCQEQTVLKNLGFPFHVSFHCTLNKMPFFLPFLWQDLDQGCRKRIF